MYPLSNSVIPIHETARLSTKHNAMQQEKYTQNKCGPYIQSYDGGIVSHLYLLTFTNNRSL